MFIHLRACSSYSFLRGLAAPLALAETAAGYGMPALALTDHHSLSGAVEFYAACLQTGVKPLLGLTALIQPPPELATDPPGLLTLLAMDLTGWGSLCHISSALVGAEEPLPFEQLASHTAGLICLTGGRCGSLYSFMAGAQRRRAEAQLASLAAIFSGRLYVELQNHAPGDEEICSRLAALAHSRQLPTLATHDIHYIAPQQAHLQQVAAAIRMIRPLNSLEPAHIAPPEAYFVPPEDMARRFERFPAALERTFEVTERCQCKLPLGVPHFPEVSLPPGQTALSELRRRAEAGARQRYQPFTSEVQARIDHELSIIEQCGYATLFLIVADILDHARRQGVPISSRGSAASSLVAHCLGITAPDPLRLNLYFERFLNPARATPPDIDTDLCSRRRDSVIQYVYRCNGKSRGEG
ncbi:MAG TPA: PHP domain-containing protein [Anaerolineaceae bacterium]|nr:PHP domain-containing protein [Anaerolineaceae bacterium]